MYFMETDLQRSFERGSLNALWKTVDTLYNSSLTGQR